AKTYQRNSSVCGFCCHEPVVGHQFSAFSGRIATSLPRRATSTLTAESETGFKARCASPSAPVVPETLEGMICICTFLSGAPSASELAQPTSSILSTNASTPICVDCTQANIGL